MMNAIITAISNVMGLVGSVKKDGTNNFHNYKYATAADVLHKLQPLLAKEGLVIFQNERSRDFLENGTILAVTYEFTIAHKGGETWPEKIVRTGMATARNAKGGFDDKSINKCHTAAHKYFHITLFEIPTGDYDDADADEDKPSVAASKIAPRRVEAPISPDGEVSPHAIAYDGNAIDWGSRYVAALKASEMVTDIAEWSALNKVTLDKIKSDAPKVFLRIEAAANARLSQLTQALEAAE